MSTVGLASPYFVIFALPVLIFGSLLWGGLVGEEAESAPHFSLRGGHKEEGECRLMSLAVL